MLEVAGTYANIKEKLFFQCNLDLVKGFPESFWPPLPLSLLPNFLTLDAADVNVNLLKTGPTLLRRSVSQRERGGGDYREEGEDKETLCGKERMDCIKLYT